jgi:hypothetical protein
MDNIMNANQPVTEQVFLKRLVNLCLRSGMTGFPKDELDQHILLKSAALTFEPGATYTEAEVNERLKIWIDQIAGLPGNDHGTLRRALIDHGYLERDKIGSSYQLSPSGPRTVQFDPAIDKIDPRQALDDARQEIEERKRAYLEKTKKQTK